MPEIFIFLVAAALMCGVVHLLADKKIAVHLKNSTKIAPFCSLLEGFSSLSQHSLMLLALSSSLPRPFCSLLGVSVLTQPAATTSTFPSMGRKVSAPGPWASAVPGDCASTAGFAPPRVRSCGLLAGKACCSANLRRAASPLENTGTRYDKMHLSAFN